MQHLSKIFIAAALAILSGCGGVPAVSQKEQDKIIVYYFHRSYRCPSCTLLEELTREAVESGFEQEIKNGKINLKIINVDETDNEHFVRDYNLSVQSVVISDIKNGKQTRWKNLDQVWTLLHEGGTLIEYIRKEIRGYQG